MGQLFQAVWILFLEICLIAVGPRPFLDARDYSLKQMALQRVRQSGMDLGLGRNWISDAAESVCSRARSDLS